MILLFLQIEPGIKLEQSQVMLVNSLKYIKDHLGPETYHNIIKHCFDAGGVSERLQLVTKRKRARVEDEDEVVQEEEEEEDVRSESEATNMSPCDEGENDTIQGKDQNNPGRVEGVNSGHEFEELTGSIRDTLTGMEYQNHETTKQIELPHSSMTLKDLSDNCISSMKYHSNYSVEIT